MFFYFYRQNERESIVDLKREGDSSVNMKDFLFVFLFCYFVKALINNNQGSFYFQVRINIDAMIPIRTRSLCLYLILSSIQI